MTDSEPVDQDLDAIVAEVERFVREQLPADWVAAVDRNDTDALVEARRSVDPGAVWEQIGAAGYITPTWPKEHGGLGVKPKVAAAIARTLGRYRMPRFDNPVGVDLAGPAILRWGTDDQKRRFVAPIARHQEIWCQLFSEPGAGSDLAGLATRAVRDGDTWIVRGQKVWTSLGHIAAFGLLLARTDPDVPKHKGITAFLVPMDQPGILVRPLRQITGDPEFSEVFFDEVAIDDSLRLGDVDQGWAVAISVLMNERQSVAGGAALPGTVAGRSIAALIERHAPVADPVLRAAPR